MLLNLKNSLQICRIVFFSLIIVCVFITFYISKSFNIDTNLADVSPKNSHSVATDHAIESLSKFIEKKIILLISGTDEDLVFDAQDELTDKLSDVNGIKVQFDSDQLSSKIINDLKPYRFSLLTQSQRSRLLSLSAQQIAEQSKNSLYELSSAPRILNFNDDPLGWHSETCLSLLQESSIDNENNEAEEFFSLTPITIEKGALNINTQAQLSNKLNGIIKQIESDYTVNVDRSGIFFFATHAAKSSKKDISFISTFSSIGIALLLLLVFRNVRALLLPVISIGIGVGFAFVLTHFIYGSVHILTIVFGASLIGIVVDYSLHYFYHQASETDKTNTLSLYKALSFSLMTSLIGYTALSFSSLQALQKVAIFSCIGLFMAWLSVVCLGNIGLSDNFSNRRTIFTLIVEKSICLIEKFSNRVWLSISMLVLVLATFVFITLSPFNDNPKVFFTAPENLLVSEQKVAAIANDYEPGRYIIISGQTLEQIYQRHTLLNNVIDSDENLLLSDFTNLLSLVPSSAEQEKDYQLQSKLYLGDNSNSSAANILRQSLAQLPTDDLSTQYKEAKNKFLTPDIIVNTFADSLPPLWFSSDKGYVNFVLIKKGVNADSLSNLLIDVDGVEYINTLQRTESALKEQRVSATTLLFLAYFLVGGLILLFYRSLSSLSLLIVPLCSSAFVLIASQILNFELNLFHVMALFLVLGFGMDYTIFSKEMRDKQSVTLEAILLSACTSVLSFGLLSLSSIPVVASFGITLLIGNIFNLIGAFIYARSQPLQGQFS